MELYKYQGAGNDFLVVDNRDGRVVHGDDAIDMAGNALPAGRIAELCDRRYGIGADGLMLLETASGADFRMVYYNSDGSGGMMCGNGGRCIVAFAADCGIKRFCFEAADGRHDAEILSASERSKVVRLKMKDVSGIQWYGKDNPARGIPVGYFMDTGTRHFVTAVDSLQGYDVFGEGRRIRYNEEFAPVGTNVNFIAPAGDVLCVRTYEKGVEDETFACGTGITASAIAAWQYSHSSGCGVDDLFGTVLKAGNGRHVHVDIRALRDSLAVDFIPEQGGATDVWLTGPAVYVGKIII